MKTLGKKVEFVELPPFRVGEYKDKDGDKCILGYMAYVAGIPIKGFYMGMVINTIFGDLDDGGQKYTKREVKNLIKFREALMKEYGLTLKQLVALQLANDDEDEKELEKLLKKYGLIGKKDELFIEFI